MGLLLAVSHRSPTEMPKEVAYALLACANIRPGCRHSCVFGVRRLAECGCLFLANETCVPHSTASMLHVFFYDDTAVVLLVPQVVYPCKTLYSSIVTSSRCLFLVCDPCRYRQGEQRAQRALVGFLSRQAPPPAAGKRLRLDIQQPLLVQQYPTTVCRTESKLAVVAITWYQVPFTEYQYNTAVYEKSTRVATTPRSNSNFTPAPASSSIAAYHGSTLLRIILARVYLPEATQYCLLFCVVHKVFVAFVRHRDLM